MADTRRELSALQTLLADNTTRDVSAQDARDVLVSESPSFVHPTSAFASPPSTPVTGDVWMPSDSVYVLRYSGSTWVPWGPVFPFTDPSLQTWSWVNQNNSTVSVTNGGIYLAKPLTTGLDLTARVHTAPATPYTITAYILPLWPFAASSTHLVGICFRQSSDGKLHVLALNITSLLPHFGSSKYSSPTSFSADYSDLTIYNRYAGMFMRIADDGTNRITSVSYDGVNFMQFTSVGRTDFITADQVGFFCGPFSGTNATGMTVISWKVG